MHYFCFISRGYCNLGHILFSQEMWLYLLRKKQFMTESLKYIHSNSYKNVYSCEVTIVVIQNTSLCKLTNFLGSVFPCFSHWSHSTSCYWVLSMRIINFEDVCTFSSWGTVQQNLHRLTPQWWVRVMVNPFTNTITQATSLICNKGSCHLQQASTEVICWYYTGVAVGRNGH